MSPAELESAWIYHLHQLSHVHAKIHRVRTARVVRWRLTKAKLRAQLATLSHKTLQSKRDLVQRAIWFPHEKGYIWRASVGGMFVGLKDFWVERLELSFSLTCTTSHVVVIFHGTFCGQFDGVKVKGDKGTRIPNAKWTQVDVDMHFLHLIDSSEVPMAALLRACDVHLANLYTNAFQHTLEAVAAGGPTVTLPGQLWRTRVPFGVLRHINAVATVATSAADYVRLAVRAAGDQPFRDAVVATLHSNGPKLFGDDTAVIEWTRFLHFALDQARRVRQETPVM
ncbi:hypothetical protein DYB26_008810 [Aphanomyces astaci]|uniref:Uncharacterized protein n=1 Tax=Aphanomyces astaci TaxID=112090 RepID=A0A418EB15_APHAT|nr:hypothetical protein DYB26_008810 [Aphanomyces astaci]